MKTLLIDQDGVLADFSKELYREWERRHPEKEIVDHEDRTLFYLRDEQPEHSELLKDICLSEGFFRNFEPIPGAIEAVKELEKSGQYDIFICTSPIASSRHCLYEKYDWIKEHLGIDFLRKTITAKDKTLIRGDILIDDKPEVKGKKEPTWEHVLFDQPYNRDIKDKRRMTWENWKEVLM